MYRHPDDCVGREVFDNWQLAQKVAKRRNRKDKVTASPYRCERCQGYHIGNKQLRGIKKTPRKFDKRRIMYGR